MNKDKEFWEELNLHTQKIIESDSDKKLIIAGPGTGKSYLFQEAIKKSRSEGKKNFLAITFIGKLGDFLADDLAGLAQTMTLHAFARKFVL
ncbi:MAG: helicase II/ATP-dependent helicase PcrA, partial [Candidatus Dadabacteria bacterium]|nr:helicase II/ATP-dependent helicase PcrA [Candidatus Dadabacteria bacterium]